MVRKGQGWHHGNTVTVDRSLQVMALKRMRMRIGDSFIGRQEFVVGYSKAPEQLQSSARPICHSHAMTSTGREPATIHIAA